MKTILIALLLTCSKMIFSQEIKTPYFLIQNNDTIGVVFSVEQAQKIDNNFELLDLLEELQIDCENLDSSYVKIINALGEEVLTLKSKSDFLTSQVRKKDDEIRNLKLSNTSLDSACTTCEELVEVNKLEIIEYKKQIRKHKIQKLLSIGSNVGLVAIIVTIILKI